MNCYIFPTELTNRVHPWDHAYVCQTGVLGRSYELISRVLEIERTRWFSTEYVHN